MIRVISNKIKKGLIGSDYKLFKSVEEGDYEKVKIHLKKGADVNTTDYMHNTPMHLASFLGNEEMVRILLRNGGDINAVNRNGETPLSVANTNFPHLIEYLEGQGAVL